MDKYDWTDLRDLYVTKQMSVRDIAKIKGCGPTTVRTNLRHQQVERRSVSKSTALLWKQGKHRDIVGANNPNWHGGKKKTGRGYLSIMAPKHHRANKDGYVLEHIAVWETVHNRELPKGWVVHHLNGIKNDNRPRNLKALPYEKHHAAVLLQEVQKSLREVETENRLLRKALDDGQMIFNIAEN